MNMWRIGAALLPLLALGACQSVAPATPEMHSPNGLAELPPPQPGPTASMERMSEISRVLASDEFQGRSMGTVGEERTAARRR